jgi:hypothetical protein
MSNAQMQKMVLYDKKERMNARFHEVFDIWQFGFYLNLEL